MPLFVFLIAPGFTGNESKMDMAINLTRITFPFLFFVSLSSFFSAILNSHNRFAVAAAAPVILNIFLIVVLVYGNFLGDSLVYYLSYGVTVAGITQFFYLYFYVKKFYLPKFSFKISIDYKIKNFFSKLLPSIFSSGVTQINILVGTIIASFQASAVSYLYYADRVYQINLAVAGIAVGTVMLPELSKHVQNRSFEKVTNLDFRKLYKRGFNADSVSGVFRITNENLEIKKPIVVKSGSSQFSWTGKISRDKKGNLDNLNLEVIMTLPLREYLPAYALVLGGPITAGVVYIAGKAFERNLDKVSSGKWIIEGNISEPKTEFDGWFEESNE